MAPSVADFLLARLHAWGVRRIYGYPGDGINGILGALDRAREQIEFVQSRHEETAALMACGHAKFTGEPGVCLATSGPGAIHLLNGLYDAKLDHQPVVAIVGQQARTALGSSYQQEVDLPSLFKDVAGEYVVTVTDPAQVRHAVDRAVRIALAERTVSCLIFPGDVQELAAVETPPHEHGTAHSGIGYARPRVVPESADLERAAQVLNEGERVAMLVGAGALGASEEVMATAETLGAGVAKALLGRAALSDDLPYVTGAIGLLGTTASWALMRGCDTLLVVGSGFPYAEYLPDEGSARGVQIDLDARMLSLRYPMEVALVGDSAATLRALLPLLDYKRDRSWQEKIEGEVREWWEIVEARALDDADPVNPQLVFSTLSERLPDGCILAADSGSAANWFARNLRLRPGMMASISGTLATMGCGVPYAFAAKLAYPDRVTIALVGDGAMQMNGLAELATIAAHWREWADPRLIVLVLNNGDLNQVTWEQRALGGDRKFDRSQELPPVPYARFAELLGLNGICVSAPEELGPAWDRAFSSDRPVVLEALVDPEVAPVPPHVTGEQARNLFAAAWGDPARGRMLTSSLRQKLGELIPWSR